MVLEELGVFVVVSLGDPGLVSAPFFEISVGDNVDEGDDEEEHGRSLARITFHP